MTMDLLESRDRMAGRLRRNKSPRVTRRYRLFIYCPLYCKSEEEY